MIVLDTTVLIDLTKNKVDITTKLNLLEQEHPFYTTQINMFELMRGVYALKDSAIRETKINLWRKLFSSIHLLDMNAHAAFEAAKIAGTLQREGQLIEDSDCLTAGIALANGITTILTRNTDHFSRIKGLMVMGY